MSRVPPALRRVFCALLAVGFVAAPAACATSDDMDEANGRDRSTTTDPQARGAFATLVKNLLSDEVAADSEEARCAADRFVQELGEREALALNDDFYDFVSLPEDVRELVRDTLNECMSGSALANDLVTELYVNLLGPDGDPVAVTVCVFRGLAGSMGDLMLEAGGVGAEIPESIMALLDECVPSAEVAASLTHQFERSGLPPEQARCLGDRLAERMTFMEFAQIGLAEDGVPPEIQAVLAAEAAACGATAPVETV